MTLLKVKLLSEYQISWNVSTVSKYLSLFFTTIGNIPVMLSSTCTLKMIRNGQKVLKGIRDLKNKRKESLQLMKRL